MKKWICKLFGHHMHSDLISSLTWMAMEEILFKLNIVNSGDADGIVSKMLDKARCTRCKASQWRGIWET